MSHTVIFKTKAKRRREGKTNSSKRLELLKSIHPRLVVRTTANKCVCQIVEYSPAGDKNLANATSLELKKYGYKGHNGNAAASYLTGYLIAKKAASKKIKECVLDIGLRTPVHGSNAFAALKGAVDAGLIVAHSKEAFPKDERMMKPTVKEAKAEMDKGIKPARPKQKPTAKGEVKKPTAKKEILKK
ncbi:50S ribosomal protein L18 [Candidatus Micrarchaeota archaeon]|nr:50S ribosomal protein L18 [Candidatus Micrarchaeota archaeon]